MRGKRVEPRVETFGSPGHNAVTIKQNRDGSLIVTGATVGPASTNGLRLIPTPQTQEVML